jgi:MFS family permease
MLGFVEAVFFPGALFYLTMFYTRKQFAFRAAILYSGSQLGNAFGTLLAIGITKLDGAHGIAGWRWLFLIEGILTVGLAIVFALYLPNSPRKVMWLNEKEHEWLAWNYKNDQKQTDDSSEITAWQGFSMAVSDPKTWLMMGTLYATYTSAAVNNFFPTVVAGLGFSTNASYGLTAVSVLKAVLRKLLDADACV